MGIKEQLLREIEHTPEPTLKEILDFLIFLKSRTIQPEKIEASLLSEPILVEEWLSPAEDAAWQHL